MIRDEQGVLRLGGIKYIMFVYNHALCHMDVQGLARQYPYLTLGQIHAGLSYYYDHKSELDAELERREREANELFAEFGTPNDDLRAKMSARRSQGSADAGAA